MKLISLKVKNFRCLYDTDWIPFSNFSIFTGENDGGKSTTLAALQIFLDRKQKPTEDDYSYSTDLKTGPANREKEIIISANLSLTENERELLRETWGHDAPEIEITRYFSPESTTSPYYISLETLDDSRFEKPIHEHSVADLDQIISDYNIDSGGAKLKADKVSQIKGWFAGQKKTKKEVNLPNDLVDRLPELQLFSSESAVDPEGVIRQVLQTRFRSFLGDQKQSGTVKELIEKAEVELQNEVEKLTPFVQQYSKDIKKVSIRTNFNFANGLSATELQIIRQNDQPILLAASGAGQKRRFSLAVYEWNLEVLRDRGEDSTDVIVAFDEPDTHLDYGSQRQIFDTIRKFAEIHNTSVVVCTHSANFLERVPIDQIVYYSLDSTSRKTKTEILTTEDHDTTELFLYRISENVGLRNTVLLHERCFLIVEGMTEFYALPVMFNEYKQMALQSAGICLINADNNFGVRMLVKFLAENRRRFVFLIDNDVTSSDIKKYFTPSFFQQDSIDPSLIFYIGTKEFEDSFSDQDWAKMATKHYPKPDGTDWKATDFANLRSNPKFSKGIQNLIKTTCNLPDEPSKPKLGLLLAKTIPVKNYPKSIIDCFNKAFSLANS